MRTFATPIGSAVHHAESGADLDAFEAFMAAPCPVAVDTETTSLDVFTPGHAVRLVQFGRADEAWVLRADRFDGAIREALTRAPALIMHNAVFDMLVLDRHGLARLEDLSPKTTDTRILAHLLDPRARQEGGTGHELKDLARVFVDPGAPDSEAALVKVFHSLGETKDTGWSVVPVDHPDYVTYAGLDTTLTFRLWQRLTAEVAAVELGDLATFEHHLQGLLAILQRRGMRLDLAYTRELRGMLDAEASHYTGVARRYGVEKVGSPKQVADALVAMGETLTGRTRSGALQVDKETLLPLADLDRDWQRIGAREPNPLADAVVRAKRAGKWASTYAGAFLDLADDAGRLHPWINPLQARTARMSVSRPPLQQLPSSDWRVRRCFIPDPGMTIIAADYSQVEMRVLAALADEPAMREAIGSGTDLHDYTASLVFGPDFTKAQRKIAKAVGFGKVYGGGADSIARQTGAPVAAVQGAIQAYDRVYPGVRRFGKRLQRRAEFGACEVITPAGRHLPLDRDRLYSATNYVVQSTARDLLAQAVVDCFDKGLGEYLLLPIHDELLGQAPVREAETIVREIGITMESNFLSVDITSDISVYGPSWGHGYGAPS